MSLKHSFVHNPKESGYLPIVNKKRDGNGFADVIPTTNFIGNVRELISDVSNVAKAAGSVANATSKITQTKLTNF